MSSTGATESTILTYIGTLESPKTTWIPYLATSPNATGWNSVFPRATMFHLYMDVFGIDYARSSPRGEFVEEIKEITSGNGGLFPHGDDQEFIERGYEKIPPYII